MRQLEIKPKSECRWDCVTLGEVMIRLDPGNGRVSTSRGLSRATLLRTGEEA
jgi:2-dehydro-3-deoxygluconokinase